MYRRPYRASSSCATATACSSAPSPTPQTGGESAVQQCCTQARSAPRRAACRSLVHACVAQHPAVTASRAVAHRIRCSIGSMRTRRCKQHQSQQGSSQIKRQATKRGATAPRRRQHAALRTRTGVGSAQRDASAAGRQQVRGCRHAHCSNVVVAISYLGCDELVLARKARNHGDVNAKVAPCAVAALSPVSTVQQQEKPKADDAHSERGRTAPCAHASWPLRAAAAARRGRARRYTPWRTDSAARSGIATR